MTSRRDIRAQRRAASERDYSWTQERDDDEQRESAPDEEHASNDELADLARSCLS
jgi:hypothetical protein